MRPIARSLLVPSLLLAAAWTSTVSGQQREPNAQHAAPGAQHSTERRPATLQRLVRHFDFEEADDAPYDMPLHWYRYAAEDGALAQGFPPFGAVRLTNEVAYSGRWSFEFELDGGSLAARVPTAVIPIMPLANYVVLARVRTEGLLHARAGLAAWLHDQRGTTIEPSRVQSRLIRTHGEWDTVAVYVRGRYEDAADLVIELQLLQPRHFGGTPHAGRPLLEDMRGRAWFDDVTVWHVPHVDMILSQPVAVDDRAVTPARLTMMVLDLAHDELEARLRVFDLEGEIVFDHDFPAPRTPIPRSFDVPLPRYGWHRAVLDVSHEGELTARRSLDFIHAPPEPPRTPPQAAPDTISFGLAMPESWRDHAGEVANMAKQAGAGIVILPVLTRDMRVETARELHRQSRIAVEGLRRDRVEIIFALSSMPADLARHLGVSGDDVLFALRGDDSVWREYLDELLVNFAFEVERWQIGPTGTAAGSGGLSNGGPGGEAFWHRDLPAIISRARQGLARFVPEPVLSLPLPVEHAGLPHAGEDGRTIVIPYATRPEAIDGFGRSNSSSEVDAESRPPQSTFENRTSDKVIAVLELPSADLYHPRERVADLAFRVLYAWRRGLSTIAIAPPWTIDMDGRPMPEPTLGVWRAMGTHLTGRRFAGELALGSGLHAWILEGPDPDDAALVAWSDRMEARPGQSDPEQTVNGTPDSSSHVDAQSWHSFTMQLAVGPVEAVDLFGNARHVPLRSGEHTVHLRETPIFIEGISAPLVKFRGGFALDPPLVASEVRAHEHAIVMHNPWNMPISGTIRLADDVRWRITPRTQQFIIRPGEEARLPVQIVLDRGIPAGRKKLHAHITISADANYRLDLETEFEVGLPGVDLSATWHIVRNLETGDDDLVVTQYILNKSDPEAGGRTINADAFVIAPNIRQERRLITGLEPGELAVRSFHIPGGARMLAGRAIRVGLSSRDSPARLNLILEIPQIGETVSIARD